MDLIWSLLVGLLGGIGALGHRLETTLAETSADGSDPVPPPPN